MLYLNSAVFFVIVFIALLEFSLNNDYKGGSSDVQQQRLWNILGDQ